MGEASMITKDQALEIVSALGDFIEAKISDKVRYPESGDYFRVKAAEDNLVQVLREVGGL